MHRWILLSSLGVVALILGCGGSGDKLPTVQAGGVVTLNGQPVEGANVYFAPLAKPGALSARAAYGITDSRGKFRLNTTPTCEGALAGNYSVGISKTRSEGGASVDQGKTPYAQGKDPRSSASSAPKFVNDLPEQYRDPTKSGFKVEVKKGEANEFAFNLKKE